MLFVTVVLLCCFISCFSTLYFVSIIHFFFFKQKTEYEMRISDWSSDVCSSDLIKAAGAVAGIQIAHAGRKASANRPWEGDDHIPEGDPRGWQPIAPSAIPFGANLPRRPRAMTKEDIRRVHQDYVAAARRALAAGFDWLELHFAHGYLAQSFLSPHSNQRDDEYG